MKIMKSSSVKNCNLFLATKLNSALGGLKPLNKISGLVFFGLLFSGCNTDNPFYDDRSKDVAKQLNNHIRGLNLNEKQIFKDKSFEKKLLKDFEYV